LPQMLFSKKSTITSVMQKNSGFSDIPFLLQRLKKSAYDHAKTLKYSIHIVKITPTFFSSEGTKKKW